MILRADWDLEEVFLDIYNLSEKKWTQKMTSCEKCDIGNAKGHLYSFFDQIYLFYDLEDSYVNLNFGLSSAYKISPNGSMTDFGIGYPFSQEYDPDDYYQGFSKLAISPFYTRNYKNISILI